MPTMSNVAKGKKIKGIVTVNAYSKSEDYYPFIFCLIFFISDDTITVERATVNLSISAFIQRDND